MTRWQPEIWYEMHDELSIHSFGMNLVDTPFEVGLRRTVSESELADNPPGYLRDEVIAFIHKKTNLQY